MKFPNLIPIGSAENLVTADHRDHSRRRVPGRTGHACHRDVLGRRAFPTLGTGADVRLERGWNAPRGDQAGHGRYIRNALVIHGNGSETSAAYALGDSGDAFLARWTLHTRVVAGCSLTAVVRLAADLAEEEKA
jgi:hypothetical protein